MRVAEAREGLLIRRSLVQVQVGEPNAEKGHSSEWPFSLSRKGHHLTCLRPTGIAYAEAPRLGQRTTNTPQTPTALLIAR